MDLGPVDHITADAVGEPGERTFYIQARAGNELVTVIVEKQQVQLLAASVMELLEDAPATEPTDRRAAMGLQEPLDPRWRAGRLSIGFDQDRDLFLLEVEEFQPDLEDLDVDDAGSPPSRRPSPSRSGSGVAGADACALPPRGGGGRARPADVPVLRESDRRGGPCVSRDERALEAGLTDPAIPRVLATGELEVLGLLPNASNHTFLARAHQEDEDMLGVYKPRRGETPLWDFPEGTLCAREVATYVVARTLGWPNVPATVFATVRSGRLGPAIRALRSRGALLHPAERFPAQFRRVAAFDLVINNADRKAGHCLLGEDGRIYVVDHGGVFQRGAQAPHRDLGFHRGPLEDAVRADMHRLADEVQRGRCAWSWPTCWPSPSWMPSRSRAREVGAMERFPEPGEDHRPFPWPPI